MEESYGTSSFKRNYVKNSSGNICLAKGKSHSTRNRSIISISHFFRTVFLPQGYPESVSEDYLTYQIWDTVQAFASSITGTLAAQAVLKGYGVGDESATVLAATLTWLLKDGTGMLGRIMFAWFQGTNLDCDAKRWRLFADIINDMAIFLEIMAPNFPMVFTFILCTSGVLKSIVGVSGGATRAALTQHQARRNNMADVSAKDGSQETLVNLAALLCSLLLVPIVTGRHMLIWTLYIVFTCLHLFANFTAVKGVIMETLNQARLHILLQEYFSTGIVLPPNVVNRREPVLWSTRRKLKIHLGVSLVKMSAQSFNMEAVIDILKVKKYVLWFDRKDSINISLSVTSDFMDQLRSCYHAELLNYMAEGKTVMLPKNIYYGSDASYQEILTGEEGSCSFVEDTFNQFIQDLHSHGWQTDVCLLGSNEWRTNIHPHTDTLHTKNL